MRRKMLIVVILSIVLTCSFLFWGCSAGPSMPESANQETDTPDEIYGDWSGTWTSYGGSTGEITQLKIVQKREDTVYFEGSISLTGMGGISDGTIEGSQSDTDVKFKATFNDTTYIEYSGVRVGDTIQGTYARYDNGEETDSGNFLVNRN